MKFFSESLSRTTGSGSPRLILALLAGSSLLFGTLAMADGFEDGIPDGWTCEGVCGTAGADGDISLSPSGFDAYGWVATRSDSPTGLALEGVGGDGNPTTGSRLRSAVFSASGGDDLEFFFNYVTSDGGGFSDYSWARLLDDGLNEVALLFTARTTPGGNTVPGFQMPAIEATITPDEVGIIDNATNWSPLGTNSGSCFSDGCGNTGWIQSNFEIPAAGDYVLEFGVVNWNDTQFQSGFAFDGITVAGDPIGPGDPTDPEDPTDPPEPLGVPTLSAYGVILFSLMLLLLGMTAVRLRG